MKKGQPCSRLPQMLGLSFCIFLAAFQTATAVTTEQTVNLSPGWNAVWLEVAPIYTTGDDAETAMSVEDAFDTSTHTAISVVARLDEPVGTAEFISQVNEATFSNERWGVWRRSSPVGENSLGLITGDETYLIKVEGSTPLQVSVTGIAEYFVPTWRANRYNLLNFNLKAPVAFSTFFGAATAQHPINRIFRLEPAGNWIGVQGTTLMQPGESYWIYADGPSNFSGPVQVRFRGNNSGALNFGNSPGNIELSSPNPTVNGGNPITVNKEDFFVTNLTSSPQPVTLVKAEPSTTGGAAFDDALQIYEISPDSNTLSYLSGGLIANYPLDPLPAGASDVITLGAYRNWSTGSTTRENLYRIELAHHYFWLPVRAGNIDSDTGASETPLAAAQGLWIGEVILDRVSSLTEPGTPDRQTTGKNSMRIIVHVDEVGQTSLLSSVMVMARETGDQVLVVDEAKIPFFEGIEQRGGVSVGQRLDSVSYDMPRKIDVTTQSALLDEVAAATPGITEPTEVTEAHIADYLSSRSGRPIALADDYHQSWPLEGGVGANTVLRTPPANPLSLDPFHRSNPFRHAFHRKHTTGYNVTRAIAITFDENVQTDLITGSYQEIYTGLAAMPITAKGRVTLQRVNHVGSLE